MTFNRRRVALMVAAALLTTVLSASCGRQEGGGKSEISVLEAKLAALDIAEAALIAMEEGVKQMDAGNYEQAARSLRKATQLFEKVPDIEIDPRLNVKVEKGHCHGLLGTVLSQLGRDGEAVEETKKALALYAGAPGTEEQQKACREFIRATEDLDKARRKEAKAKRDVDEAEQKLKKEEARLDALKSARDNIQEGLKLVKAEDFAGAVVKLRTGLSLLEKGAASDESLAYCHEAIGIALAAQDLDRDAIVEFTKALNLYRNVPGTADEQARCLRLIDLSKSGPRTKGNETGVQK